MRAIDTNVVVRFLVADDDAQARRARSAIEAGDIFIPTTVLLESEWVLRAAYGFSPGRIVAALRGLAGLSGIAVEDPPLLAMALDWAADGMDFADALHLAKSGECAQFLSFDRGLAKAAASRSPVAVRAP